jgi:hypothetical protein
VLKIVIFEPVWGKVSFGKQTMRNIRRMNMNRVESLIGKIDAQSVRAFFSKWFPVLVIVASGGFALWFWASDFVIGARRLGVSLSAATSGITQALWAIPFYVYMEVGKNYTPWKRVGLTILAAIPALFPYLPDTFFDTTQADVDMLGAFVATPWPYAQGVWFDPGVSGLSVSQTMELWMRRWLYFALTTFGDPFGGLMLTRGMVFLGNWFGSSQPTQSYPRPMSPPPARPMQQRPPVPPSIPRTPQPTAVPRPVGQSERGTEPSYHPVGMTEKQEGDGHGHH